MRAAIGALRPGTYVFIDACDDDGQGDEPILLKAAVTVGTDAITVDFTGSSAQVPTYMNAPPAVTASATYYATKSFVASLSAWLHLAAAWGDLGDLRSAIARLPDRLAAATGLDWSAALQALCEATSLVSLGRGPTLAIAREAALKLKETSNLHAEAFSGAEFLHGPIALVESSYPALLFVPTDQASDGLRALAADLRRKNANVFMSGEGEALPALTPDHPDTDANAQRSSSMVRASPMSSPRRTCRGRSRFMRCPRVRGWRPDSSTCK